MSEGIRGPVDQGPRPFPFLNRPMAPMLFASGFLALICSGLALNSLVGPVSGPRADEPDASLGPPDRGADAGGGLTDDDDPDTDPTEEDDPMPDGSLLPASQDEAIAGYGTVPVISDFMPGVDRLLLDFDAGAPRPDVTLNLAIEPGSTAVMGDGLLMVVLRGVTGVSTTDIELRAYCAQDDPPPDAACVGRIDGAISMARLLGLDEDMDDLPDSCAAVPVVTDFDRNADVIEVVYDPSLSPDPVIEVADLANGRSAAILLDGQPVLHVVGAQGLDPSDVTLIPNRAPIA
ncbi:hypothetical protein HKCCE3408_04170 [Rhodobacterales bacterium HKCCE3408]|nr:hypothetical protein [Rhodobacterales bacterium HKCCE3408]